MTTILTPTTRPFAVGFILILATVFLLPWTASAAESEDPMCLLIASTPRGYQVYEGTKDIGIRSGERVILAWIGQNADEAENRDEEEIGMVGLEVLSAFGSGTYSYTFTRDDEEVTCTANLILQSETLAPEPVATPVTGGALSVSSLPLLTGGTAQAGASVPVAYIRVNNAGLVPASVAGFTLTQNGSAPTDAVIGFATNDDKGGSRATIEASDDEELFDGKSAYIPLAATIPAGQVRIFTIKAQLAQSSSKIGTQLALDLTEVDSSARISANFPVRGTVWTLAF